MNNNPTKEELIAVMKVNAGADELVSGLEGLNLGWSLDSTGRLIEARVWNWPYVIGRYRPDSVEPLAMMLRGAISDAVIFCGGQASDTDERQWSLAPTRHIEVGGAVGGL
jgi:hypothetical protein